MPRFPLLFLALVPAAALAQSPAPARPMFVDGQAQIVAAFADSSQWVRQRLWVETSFDTDGDGRLDRVHVDVTRPRQTETEGLKVPTIYETSPYFAGTSGPREFLWDVKQEVDAPPPPRASQPAIRWQPERAWISRGNVATWVPRGFAVVHSESPGTGLSQGCPTVGGPNEELAPKAVIDWLNGRARGFTTLEGSEEVRAEWSTGKVGMTGTSYNGTLPVAAATTGVEGLAAIIPIAPNTSYYRYYRSNGLVRSPGGWLGEDMDFLYDFINSGDPSRRDFCNRTVRDGELRGGMDRTTGDWNDFWEARDYWERLGNIKAATLLVHGLNDWNVMPEHSVHVYEELKRRKVPAAIYLHQGGHGGGPTPELMNRWFTRFLYDVENGVEDGPHAWVVREDSARTAPTEYEDFPHPAAQRVRLNLTGGGNTIGGLTTGKASTRREILIDNVDSSGAALARSAESTHRLIYATPELTAPLHLSGTARVRIRMAASKPAANLSVWLVALPWNDPPRGRANFSVITRGWADPQNHRSLERGEPLEPGKFYDVEFDLQPDDQVIPAGKRIALMIFSSDREFTVWPQPGTALTVELDKTTLELPVVGGKDAWEGAVGAQQP
jgi:X-Pro dipeptidyl-peptidase